MNKFPFRYLITANAGSRFSRVLQQLKKTTLQLQGNYKTVHSYFLSAPLSGP
jgi:hypothetical protein